MHDMLYKASYSQHLAGYITLSLLIILKLLLNLFQYVDWARD